MKQVLVHIGTHKTGSTSLQRYLADHRNELRNNGAVVYKGAHKKTNHIELYLASMRYCRDSLAKQMMIRTVFDSKYTKTVTWRVNRFLSKLQGQEAIFTTEGLSLLRHQDEMERLRGIFNPSKYDVRIVLYLRSKAAFLNSYRKQLLKVVDRVPSNDFQSALYVEDDTWLIDYEGLITAYAQSFGKDNVHVIDYDEELKRHQSIIPSFFRVTGIPIPDVTNLSDYYLNRTRGKEHRKVRVNPPGAVG